MSTRSGWPPATMLPARRAAAVSNAGSDMGDEITAQTWSYAAAVHLGLIRT
ncbi:MAG: hypothetical protein ABSD67_23605 [Terracidiphilus sp.]